jgi:hypothetical protein
MPTVPNVPKETAGSNEVRDKPKATTDDAEVDLVSGTKKRRRMAVPGGARGTAIGRGRLDPGVLLAGV